MGKSNVRNCGGERFPILFQDFLLAHLNDLGLVSVLLQMDQSKISIHSEQRLKEDVKDDVNSK